MDRDSTYSSLVSLCLFQRIGDLLNRFGLVSTTDLERALAISKCTGLPVGKSLVALELIKEKTLSATIEIQSMLRDELLTLPQARAAARLVADSDYDLTDALRVLGLNDDGAVRRNRLGEILVDSGALQSDQLEFGLTISESSGLPLGQVLVLLNRVSEGFVRMALALQYEIRAKTIVRERAIIRLRSGMIEVETIDKIDDNLVPNKVPIGRLLSAAGLISERVLFLASTAAMRAEKLLGQYLVESDLVPSEQLNLAMRLQALVWKGRLSYQKAVVLLNKASKHVLNDAEVTSHASIDGNSRFSFFDFLKMSGYLNDQRLESIIDIVNKEPKLLARANAEPIVPSQWSRTEIVAALHDPVFLRYALSLTYPLEQRVVNSALLLFSLSTNQAISLSQALVNFVVKWNGDNMELLQSA